MKASFTRENELYYPYAWSGNGNGNELLQSGNGVEMKNKCLEWNWNGVGMKIFENAHHWLQTPFFLQQNFRRNQSSQEKVVRSMQFHKNFWVYHVAPALLDILKQKNNFFHFGTPCISIFEYFGANSNLK